jgi:hypothetical protein
MDEEEFDSWMQSRQSRPLGREDAMRAEAQLLRGRKLLATLGVALWGRTSGDLQRQLLAVSPEVPSGFDLPDFQALLQVTTQIISGLQPAQKIASLSHLVLSQPTIFVGTQAFTEWEARREVLRRTIEYLEKR